ncbi:MAG: hypothetical protein ACRD5M_06075 [Candidatus Acidiferrales bacterium]
MSARENAINHSATLTSDNDFAPLSARRMLVIGGIALILTGMILGDIFAVFILHPNADRIGSALLSATQAVAAKNPESAGAAFAKIGGYLENRGTKVDAHAHMISFGYIALLLALLQPYVAFTELRKKFLAKLFLLGAALLPMGVFLIHYVGLAGSPLESIGWASIFADLGGALVLVACVGELAGLWRHLHRESGPSHADELLADRSWPSRALLSGGTLLILLGFMHGTYYAAANLYRYEARDSELLSTMTAKAAANDLPGAKAAVGEYGQLQGAKAVNIAAHSHIIEFGILSILIAFFQRYVFFGDRWRRIWAVTLLIGSLALPFFVLMELRWGLLAGGLADIGGLLVIIALLAMLVGIWRYTGKLDAAGADS